MEADVLGGKYKLLVVGGSAGSLRVLMEFLPKLTSETTLSLIVVLHRSNARDTLLNELLASKTKLSVREAEEKDKILPATLYVAPADYHLLIESDGTLSLDSSEKINFSRPSIDVTFESAAYVYGEELACLLLSGANTDGVTGLQVVKKLGGLVLVQSPASSDMPVMPEGAINAGVADMVLLPSEMATVINKLG